MTMQAKVVATAESGDYMAVTRANLVWYRKRWQSVKFVKRKRKP